MNCVSSPVSQRVAAIISEELRKRGFTNRALAQHLYPDRTQNSRDVCISKRLRGVTPFTLDELDLVGDFLGVPIELLLDAA